MLGVSISETNFDTLIGSLLEPPQQVLLVRQLSG